MAEADVCELAAVWEFVRAQFALGPDSLHGPDPWRRVEANGIALAAGSGADVRVVPLFAVLHDARRLDEGADAGHGRRGADLAAALRGALFALDDEAFQKLYDACAGHEKGKVTAEPTVGTCWDADRLDLPRVGARPMPRYMSTPEGKRLAERHGGPRR